MKSVSATAKLLLMISTVFVSGSTVFSGEPLKVFILGGQSNMQGLGMVELDGAMGTLLYMYENDVDGTFMHVRDENGWTVRNDVWVDFHPNNGRTNGALTTGFGAKTDLNAFGPEYQFGHVMGGYFDAPVLLIKCAWGGKSLAFDFRPPSSGWAATPVAHGDEGYYYQQTIDRVNAFKADPQSFYPAYNPADGYEIVGFGWHQGWNDRVNTDYVNEYEQNMKNFIQDIRNDLDLPGLPFVIANSGFGGWDVTGNGLTLINAQLAMADYSKYPQFEGDVDVEETRDYWRVAEISPGPNQGYHWHKHAESYFLIGEGMGTKMIGLLDPNIPTVNAGTSKITWSGEPVTFNGTVDLPADSDWTNLTYDWTYDAPAGVTVTFDPPTADNLTHEVTVTKPLDGSEAIVTLTLSVNNAGRTGAPVRDTVRVFVSDDQCKAAIAKGLWPDHPTDFDGNCRTDLADFAVMALRWLHSEELTEPVVK